jgi:1-acyl-sn-glycerol-3-phosphate acyltransferase
MPRMKSAIWAIRVIVFYIGIAIATILFGASSPLLFLFPDRIRYFVITRWSHFFVNWGKKILGLKYRVHGKIPPKKTSMVVMSNHQSAWETVFMQTLLPTQSWILKKELLYIPFFGWGLALLKPVAIKRQNKGAYHQVISQGTMRLNEGRWVVIFPEGTRVLPDHYHRFAKGGASLAIESQRPILPIAHNAGRLWPRGWWIKKPGTIEVSIGPLIKPQAGESAQDLMDRVETWIRNEMQRIG